MIWIARATSSLPTPLSPVTSVVALERATRSTSSISRSMGSLTMIAVMPRNTCEGASAEGNLAARN